MSDVGPAWYEQYVSSNPLSSDYGMMFWRSRQPTCLTFGQYYRNNMGLVTLGQLRGGPSVPQKLNGIKSYVKFDDKKCAVSCQSVDGSF